MKIICLCNTVFVVPISGKESLESDKISRSEYNELKNAMEMIQQKYMHVMKDKAELSDKADQLEHLVLQLQGETDTIGEIYTISFASDQEHVFQYLHISFLNLKKKHENSQL